MRGRDLKQPRPSPRPRGRWLRPQEMPLRTTPPGRRLRVLKAGGDSELTPSADVDLVDSGKGSFVHCVGDLLAVGRVGRIGALRDFRYTSSADADRVDR